MNYSMKKLINVNKQEIEQPISIPFEKHDKHDDIYVANMQNHNTVNLQPNVYRQYCMPSFIILDNKDDYELISHISLVIGGQKMFSFTKELLQPYLLQSNHMCIPIPYYLFSDKDIDLFLIMYHQLSIHININNSLSLDAKLIANYRLCVNDNNCPSHNNGILTNVNSSHIYLTNECECPFNINGGLIISGTDIKSVKIYNYADYNCPLIDYSRDMLDLYCPTVNNAYIISLLNNDIFSIKNKSPESKDYMSIKVIVDGVNCQILSVIPNMLMTMSGMCGLKYC